MYLQLSKNVSSSDAGTYYCAVATCGEILFGHGTKLDIEGNCSIYTSLIIIHFESAPKLWDQQKAIVVLLLLAAPFAISLIVIAFLIHNIKMKTCDCCNASFLCKQIPYQPAVISRGSRMQKNNNFETKTVGVGVSVELTCPRKSSGSLFWIRIDSGDFPEVLRKKM
ncbi:hypothetical protein F7725_010468 [Dissostichus mawsoni]|uniref:Ig-like domain-containing protein n=1 Tax=Dissostichus mawsoni TaxID=36200 RepID=A0A7J5XNX4_DISMA|nr:hypothetical protein F7725_010468 [Dissostichus mawsoni]